MRFEDITRKAGLGEGGWGQGVCAGDYNNDGLRDLFVTYYGQSVLYRNRGAESSADVTEEAGLRAPRTRWDTGCTFVDYDRDGRLDLAVTNYLEFDRTKVPEAGSGAFCLWKGMPVMCGPRGLPFARNYLFHNDGDGRFTDVSLAERHRQDERAATDSRSSPRTSTTTTIRTCTSPATRRRACCISNQKNGTFREVGLLSGVALNEDGQEQGGMGVAVGRLR